MKQLKLFLLLLLLLLPVNLQAQTLVHPQKVYINPNGVGGTDALKIDGGLRAGPNGTVQVINADGSISVSATIGDGTIQKIKLGNDCATGQILVRNSSGTPAYWDCGNVSAAGGLAAGDNNITITGTGWRFQNATIFGSSTTAQELIHVYNSGGDAGIQIQNNTQAWKLLATGNALRMQNGTNYPLTLTTTQVGIFNTTPTAGYEVDITGDVRISGNILNLGSFGNHLYPTTSDAFDIGTYNTKWRNLFVGSAIFDQFIQQNVQLYNGYQIIGKKSGSFNSAVSNVATTFVADEDHEIGDYILVRGRDSGGVFNTEYLKILNKSGAGPYTYTITEGSGGRNLDGSGANSWGADTAYLVLGKQYDGRIELYAASGIPTIRVVTQGATYSAFDSLVHLGGLDGITGVTAARYGVYLGKQDGTGDYLKFQNYLGSPSGDDGKLIVKGGIVAGSYLVSSTSISLTASGLDVGTTGRIQGGRTAFASDDAGFWIGYDSGYKLYIGNADETKFLQWDGSHLTWDGGNSSMDSSGNLSTSNINATGGYLGGWVLASTVLTDASGVVGLSSAVTGGNDIRIWAGDATAANAEFKVYEDGSVSAVSGTIGGWSLTSSTLSGGGVTLNSAGSVAGGSTTLDSTGLRVSVGTSTTWADANSYRFTSASGNLKMGLGSIYDSAWSGSTKRALLIEHADQGGSAPILQSIILHVGPTDYYNIGGGDTGSNNIELSRGVSGQDFIKLYSKTGSLLFDAGTITFTGSPTVSGNFTVDTNTFFVDSINNRVGIGTTSPTFTLDLNGTMLARTGIRVQTGTTTDGYVVLSPGSSTNIGYIAWHKPTSGTRQGYLGWGTANVNLTLEDSANFTVTGGNVLAPGLVLGYTTSGTGTSITTADTDEPLYINPNGTGRVLFDGTDIEVAGIMLRNWVDGAGQGYACANVDGSADGFITYKTTASCGTSSIRYKTDVQPMSLVGIEAILDLTPVTYKLKEVPESGYIMGAIAEQAADLGLEWMVERNEKGEPETLIYDRIGLYLIPVVKAQKERIDDLERRIEALERRK